MKKLSIAPEGFLPIPGVVVVVIVISSPLFGSTRKRSVKEKPSVELQLRGLIHQRHVLHPIPLLFNEIINPVFIT